MHRGLSNKNTIFSNFSDIVLTPKESLSPLAPPEPSIKMVGVGMKEDKGDAPVP